jgi:hypothetical protein
MNRTTLSALLGLALAAPAAHAAESPLSYTYVEGRLMHSQTDAFGNSELTVNGNGGGIAGSVAFGDTGLFATASADIVEIGESDVDLERAALGLGYAWAIDESLHLVMDAKALRLRGSDNTGSISEDGYQATVGLRSLLSDDLEGTIKAGVIKVDDDVLFYDGAIVELGARWHLNAAWSVGLDGAFTKDERNGALSLRLQW